MIAFQEFMLTSKHFCLIRSDIPFRLICNPNGGDWLSGTDICNLPAGSFTFDFWKLLPEKYFKNNPAFKLGLAYDADLLTDGKKIDVSYSDLNYGSGVAGLAGSAESSLNEILLIDTLISNNLLAALQKLESGNISLSSIQSVLNDDIKQDVSDIQTAIEDNIAPDLSNVASDVNEIKSAISEKEYSNFTSGLYLEESGIGFPVDDVNRIKAGFWFEAFGWLSFFKNDDGRDLHFDFIKIRRGIQSEVYQHFSCLAKCQEDNKIYYIDILYTNAERKLRYIYNLSDRVRLDKTLFLRARFTDDFSNFLIL